MKVAIEQKGPWQLEAPEFINVNFCVRRDFMFDSFVSDMQKLWMEIDLKGGWVI